MKADQASRPGRWARNLVLASCISQIGGFGQCSLAAAERPSRDSDPLPALLAATCKLTCKESAATCFLVAPPPSAGWSNGVVLVVTAAHALEQMPGPESRIVMRERHGDNSFVRREVPLAIRSENQPLWVKHPDEDVAVLKLTLPTGVSCQPLRFDQLARAEDFTQGKIRLGSEAWIFCFPAQLEANSAGLPVLRHGSIASLPLTPLSSNRTFIVDFNTFGGDSGAPIMLGQRGTSRTPSLIIGLVLGMHRQTDKVVEPFEERTVHHPLGLCIAVHSEVIRQTVDRALKQGRASVLASPN